jgi:hypothetical protein
MKYPLGDASRECGISLCGRMRHVGLALDLRGGKEVNAIDAQSSGRSFATSSSLRERKKGVCAEPLVVFTSRSRSRQVGELSTLYLEYELLARVTERTVAAVAIDWIEFADHPP